MTYASPSMMMAPPTASRDEESKALSKILWFAIIELAGLAVGTILDFYIFGSLLSLGPLLGTGGNPSPTPSQLHAFFQPLIAYLVWVLALGVVLGLVSAVLLTSAFRNLAKIDRGRFKTPSTLLLVYIAGLAALAIGFYPLFANLATLISQAPPNTTNPPTSLGGFLVGLTLVGTGVVLILVGTIGGLILGLWRVGTKYDSTVLKIGAIFYVIPFLTIIAPVLVLVGVLEAKNKVKAIYPAPTSAPLS